MSEHSSDSASDGATVERLDLESPLNDSKEEAPTQTPKYESCFSTLMSLINTLTGSEILGIANSMTFTGVMLGVPLMVLAILLSFTSAVIVLNLQQKVQGASINDVARVIIGPWAGDLFSILTLCFTYCCLVAYLILGSNFIYGWLSLIGYGYLFEGWYRPIFVFAYAVLLPIMLTIPRKSKVVELGSTLSYGCQLLFLVSMAIKAITMFPKQGISATAETSIFNPQLFNSFSMYSLLFSLSPVMLPLLVHYDPAMKKRYVLIGGTFITSFCVVMIPSVIGYLLFGASTNQVIIMSFDEKDVLMNIVKVAYFFVVSASYPITGVIVLTELCSVMFKVSDPATLSTRQRVEGLLAMNVPPVLIAMFLPSVRPALEVGGAFGGCLSNYFVPPVLYLWYTRAKSWDWKRVACIIYAIFGVLASGIATYEAVLDAIESFSSE